MATERKTINIIHEREISSQCVSVASPLSSLQSSSGELTPLTILLNSNWMDATNVNSTTTSCSSNESSNLDESSGNSGKRKIINANSSDKTRKIVSSKMAKAAKDFFRSANPSDDAGDREKYPRCRTISMTEVNAKNQGFKYCGRQTRSFVQSTGKPICVECLLICNEQLKCMTQVWDSLKQNTQNTTAHCTRCNTNNRVRLYDGLCAKCVSIALLTYHDPTNRLQIGEALAHLRN